MDSARSPEDKGKLKARARQRKAAIIALCGVLFVHALFLVPPERMTVPVVSIITSLIWPIIVLVILVLFQPYVERLFLEITERIKGGSGLKIGSFLEIQSLPEQARKIPVPSEEQNVTLENIALLHTSFFSETGTRLYGGDGRAYYQFEVVVMAPDVVMEHVDRVVYRLENTWPEALRTRETRDRASRFKMKDLANGTSIVEADVYFRGSDQPLKLNRFIDLRPDGPRI
ncbi:MULTISPECIES: pYEATS domain-containing protein [unclassified Pseudomonas]|uniref:pYEATS domain-containing protein n=1 Tax=Pseudomonas TaxID=286 RepID=UPI000876A1E0|nr:MULTISPECIES: pYEATS domain-containing protein [unclassified Pseudomonas]SCZ57405.1 hypothetical protein SAMN03159460_01175 [Pseudomonas sp. NFPP17]SDA48971.1 hypothetical protein SAMN03159464_01357 [Pseudomonas sp. NFPP15]SEK17912.1 hypothetical protein SAMN03159324_00030 [Pseudomonas sp. NFPP18]SFA48192.1 hypothetical protein SAMN03159320_01175 [Pseudomonas sp. NFPP13]SFT53561.1 hypothetical protein SAMN03159492_01355 [Pseudomonas sp. NFPP25]